MGLQSLIRAAYEELLGSWASVTANLIAFFRSNCLNVYDKLADALDAMASENTDPVTSVIPAVALLLAVSTRAHGFLEDISRAVIDFATATVLGERLVEIPGRFAPLEADVKPKPIALPELLAPADYATAACKHECAILKQWRHVRQVHSVWKDGTMIRRALMLSRSGQCGIDTSKATLAEVQLVATKDRPEKYAHMDLSESTLNFASILHLHGLPFDCDPLRSVKPLDACPVYNTALAISLQPEPLHRRLYSWQSHMDGRMRRGWAAHADL